MKLTAIDRDYVHNVIMTERRGANEVNLKSAVPANSTANLYVSFVAKIMRFGNAPPPKFYRYSRPQDVRGSFWPKDWVALRGVMSRDLRRIMTFALATGLRIDNVINFRWEWLHERAAYLPRAATKTNQDYGIPLNATAAGVIAEIRSDAVLHHTHVFVHNGAPWKYETLLKALKSACKRASLPVMTPHWFRHSFASWLSKEGVSDSVRRRLGCWKLGGGADVGYLHFDVEWLRKFSEMLDPLLGEDFNAKEMKNGT
jgi:integrase